MFHFGLEGIWQSMCLEETGVSVGWHKDILAIWPRINIVRPDGVHCNGSRLPFLTSCQSLVYVPAVYLIYGGRWHPLLRDQ